MEKFQITTVITDMKGGIRNQWGNLKTVSYSRGRELKTVFKFPGGNFNTGGI